MKLVIRLFLFLLALLVTPYRPKFSPKGHYYVLYFKFFTEPFLSFLCPVGSCNLPCEHLDAETKVKRLQQDNIELEDCKRALENQKDGMYNSSLSSKCFKPFLKRTGGIIFYGLDFYE